jgi:hypothetical protein
MKKRIISRPVRIGKVRLAGLKSIDSNLNLNNGMSIEAYEARIQVTEKAIETYNTALSALDQLKADAQDAESDLAEYSERMLSTVAGYFGKSSREYGMAGGTQRNSNKRSKKSSETNSNTSPDEMPSEVAQ